mgnify:CR=1 FL=1
MFITPAFAADASAGGGMLEMIAPLAIMGVIFYFLLIRPQQKRAKEHAAMVTGLRRGDEVLTAGGLLGKVTKVKDGADEVEVELAENVRVRVLRSTISTVRSKTAPVAANSNS